MEEYKDKRPTGEIVLPKKGFFAWLDNFWYHYKWHTLISLFLVITITVCTIQMCDKTKYDAYILYSGSHTFERTGKNGDYPEYDKACSTLESFTLDYDKDGESNVSFRTLYTPTDDELRENGKDSAYSLAYSDRQDLDIIMKSSDYYICFVSLSVFNEFSEVNLFRDLTPLLENPEDYTFYDEGHKAVLLSSLPFSNLAGFANLPDDTVVCMRVMPALNHLNEKENKKIYTRSEEILTKILAYGH